jgi:hypothetical protein
MRCLFKRLWGGALQAGAEIMPLGPGPDLIKYLEVVFELVV